MRPTQNQFREVDVRFPTTDMLSVGVLTVGVLSLLFCGTRRRRTLLWFAFRRAIRRNQGYPMPQPIPYTTDDEEEGPPPKKQD